MSLLESSVNSHYTSDEEESREFARRQASPAYSIVAILGKKRRNGSRSSTSSTKEYDDKSSDQEISDIEQGRCPYILSSLEANM